MTLLFCDSFDHYTTVLQKWTFTSVSGSGAAITIGSSSGRFTNGLRATTPNSGNYMIYKTLPSGDDVIIVGAAVRISNYPTTNVPVFSLREASGPQHHCEIRINSAGKLFVTRNATAVGSAGTTTLSLNVWYFIEAKVTVHDSTGAAEVRINGVTELNLTGQDLRDGGTGIVDQLASGLTVSLPASFNIDFDDLYVCDGNGSTNNDFLGDVRIESVFPNGNGNSSQLVGSDGNSTDNYLLVDETAPNDADYVESSTVGEKDTYAYGNVTPTSGTVYGLQVMTRAAKTDAGARSVASIARLSGTEVDSSDKTLSTTYAYYPDIRETKPGGGAWSISDVNSAEFGVKVTA